MNDRAPKQDNLTLRQKVMLRQTALAMLGDETPVICETHGGRGDVYASVYTRVENGVVFETDHDKSVILATQRPTWAVYEADVEMALAAGAAAHLTYNLLDVDPYGSAWETIEGFFTSERPRAGRVIVVVNDGLRFRARGGSAWQVERLAPFAARYGNHAVWRDYPTRICRELMDEMAATGGYTVRRFESYSTGVEQKLVHMLAELTLAEPDSKTA